MDKWIDKYIDILKATNECSSCKIVGATDEEISSLKKKINQYDVNLVEYIKEYFEFLKEFNGFDYFGIHIFSTHTYVQDCEPKLDMIGFIEFYEDYRWYGTYKKYETCPFFFGSDGEVAFGIYRVDNEYKFVEMFLNDAKEPYQVYKDFDTMMISIFERVYNE